MIFFNFVSASDKLLLMGILMLFWRLTPYSAAGIISITSAKVFKSGNISLNELIISRQDFLNEGISSSHFDSTGKFQQMTAVDKMHQTRVQVRDDTQTRNFLNEVVKG